MEELLDTPESILKPSAIEVASAGTCLESALKLLRNIEIDGTAGIDRDRMVARGDFSISFIQIRIETIESIIGGLLGRISLAQTSVRQLRALLRCSQELHATALNFLNHTNQVMADGGAKPTTWENLEVCSLQGSQSINMTTGVLPTIFDKTEEILGLLKSIAPIHISETPTLPRLIEKIAETNQLISTETEKLNTATEAAAKSVAQIVSHQKRVEGTSKSAEELEGSIRKIRDELAALEGDTRSKKAGADEVIQAAASLKAQVDDYAAQFASFKLTLDERNSFWVKGKAELEALITSLKLENSEIEETIDRAKTMLATATNAGLTAAQENRYEKLEAELKSAGRATNLAFSLLFVSLSPLGFFIYANWDKTIAFTGGWDYATNVLVRSILLAPALLFVGFTTNRYRRIFRLKHEYGFRASLAGAVEGFKTQAPDHGVDIAAVAFYQLGRNPAETLDKEKTNPSWAEKLTAIIERFGDRFGKKPEGT
jgi:hypothetical protein